VNVDVNFADRQWTALDGKRLMPSFSSYKGIGETAIDEILHLRPFSSIEDMLWRADGSWRLSKFNKRALEALILVGGLDSLKCVGEHAIFANYKQMHSVIIDHWDDLKKSTKKDPFKGRDAMRALALETADMSPWTREEKMNNVIQIVGSSDVSLLVPDKVMEKLIEKSVPSIDDIDEEESDVAWFCVQNVTKKVSKNKKPYLLIDAIGPVGKVHKIYVWSMPDVKKMSIMMAPLEKSAFGYSTNRLVHLA
jgi:DNA polymerase III alpha subunit